MLRKKRPPPFKKIELDLDFLTSEERHKILNVIEKEKEMLDEDQKLFKDIKCSIDQLSFHPKRPGIDADKVCDRCNRTFKVNVSSFCPVCHQKACRHCRIALNREGTQWICILCKKQRRLDEMSGAWVLNADIRKSLEEKQNIGNEALSPSKEIELILTKDHKHNDKGHLSHHGSSRKLVQLSKDAVKLQKQKQKEQDLKDEEEKLKKVHFKLTRNKYYPIKQLTTGLGHAHSKTEMTYTELLKERIKARKEKKSNSGHLLKEEKKELGNDTEKLNKDEYKDDSTKKGRKRSASSEEKLASGTAEEAMAIQTSLVQRKTIKASRKKQLQQSNVVPDTVDKQSINIDDIDGNTANTETNSDEQSKSTNIRGNIVQVQTTEIIITGKAYRKGTRKKTKKTGLNDMMSSKSKQSLRAAAAEQHSNEKRMMSLFEVSSSGDDFLDSTEVIEPRSRRKEMNASYTKTNIQQENKGPPRFDGGNKSLVALMVSKFSNEKISDIKPNDLELFTDVKQGPEEPVVEVSQTDSHIDTDVSFDDIIQSNMGYMDTDDDTESIFERMVSVNSVNDQTDTGGEINESIIEQLTDNSEHTKCSNTGEDNFKDLDLPEIPMDTENTVDDQFQKQTDSGVEIDETIKEQLTDNSEITQYSKTEEDDITHIDLTENKMDTDNNVNDQFQKQVDSGVEIDNESMKEQLTDISENIQYSKDEESNTTDPVLIESQTIDHSLQKNTNLLSKSGDEECVHVYTSYEVGSANSSLEGSCEEVSFSFKAKPFTTKQSNMSSDKTETVDLVKTSQSEEDVNEIENKDNDVEILNKEEGESDIEEVYEPLDIVQNDPLKMDLDEAQTPTSRIFQPGYKIDLDPDWYPVESENETIKTYPVFPWQRDYDLKIDYDKETHVMKVEREPLITSPESLTSQVNEPKEEIYHKTDLKKQSDDYTYKNIESSTSPEIYASKQNIKHESEINFNPTQINVNETDNTRTPLNETEEIKTPVHETEQTETHVYETVHISSDEADHIDIPVDETNQLKGDVDYTDIPVDNTEHVKTPEYGSHHINVHGVDEMQVQMDEVDSSTGQIDENHIETRQSNDGITVDEINSHINVSDRDLMHGSGTDNAKSNNDQNIDGIYEEIIVNNKPSNTEIYNIHNSDNDSDIHINNGDTTLESLTDELLTSELSELQTGSAISHLYSSNTEQHVNTNVVISVENYRQQEDASAEMFPLDVTASIEQTIEKPGYPIMVEVMIKIGSRKTTEQNDDSESDEEYEEPAEPLDVLSDNSQEITRRKRASLYQKFDSPGVAGLRSVLAVSKRWFAALRTTDKSKPIKSSIEEDVSGEYQAFSEAQQAHREKMRKAREEARRRQESQESQNSDHVDNQLSPGVLEEKWEDPSKEINNNESIPLKESILSHFIKQSTSDMEETSLTSQEPTSQLEQTTEFEIITSCQIVTMNFSTPQVGGARCQSLDEGFSGSSLVGEDGTDGLTQGTPRGSITIAKLQQSRNILTYIKELDEDLYDYELFDEFDYIELQCSYEASTTYSYIESFYG